jgi:predicted transcriptional regulator of viral defense system
MKMQVTIALALLARKQAGMFTISQARVLGVSVQNSSYYLRKGVWEKQSGVRGIYRLPAVMGDIDDRLFPYWLVYLWALNKDGSPGCVISHESSLDVRNIGEIIPNAVNIVVPLDFKRRTLPPIGVRINKVAPSELEKAERSYEYGELPLTTAIDSLRYMMEAHISLEYIEAGFEDGMRQGFIKHKDMRELVGFRDEDKEWIWTWFPQYRPN